MAKGKILCPIWVLTEFRHMLDEMNGRHDDVMVGGCALLGTEGFDVKLCQQTTIVDPRQYGEMMSEGLRLLASKAFAAILETTWAVTQSPNHPVQKIKDPDEQRQYLIDLYERATRDFLQVVFTYTNNFFCEGKKAEMSVACGSRVLSLWLKVAQSRISFTLAKDHDESPKETTDGPGTDTDAIEGSGQAEEGT